MKHDAGRRRDRLEIGRDSASVLDREGQLIRNGDFLGGRGWGIVWSYRASSARMSRGVRLLGVAIPCLVVVVKGKAVVYIGLVGALKDGLADCPVEMVGDRLGDDRVGSHSAQMEFQVGKGSISHDLAVGRVSVSADPVPDFRLGDVGGISLLVPVRNATFVATVGLQQFLVQSHIVPVPWKELSLFGFRKKCIRELFYLDDL